MTAGKLKKRTVRKLDHKWGIVDRKRRTIQDDNVIVLMRAPETQAQHDDSPTLPPPSTKLFDGFSAALWGSVTGITTSLIVAASLIQSWGGSLTHIKTTCSVMTVLSVIGCSLHLWHRKRYHLIKDTKHFLRTVFLSFVLAFLMPLLLPPILIVEYLSLKFRSFNEEKQILEEIAQRPIPKWETRKVRVKPQSRPKSKRRDKEHVAC